MKSPNGSSINAKMAITFLYFVSLSCAVGYGATLALASPEYVSRLFAHPVGWMIAAGWVLTVMIVALLPFLKSPSDLQVPSRKGVARAVFGLICAVEAGLALMFGPALAATFDSNSAPPAATAFAAAYMAAAAILFIILAGLAVRRRWPEK